MCLLSPLSITRSFSSHYWRRTVFFFFFFSACSWSYKAQEERCSVGFCSRVWAPSSRGGGESAASGTTGSCEDWKPEKYRFRNRGGERENHQVAQRRTILCERIWIRHHDIRRRLSVQGSNKRCEGSVEVKSLSLSLSSDLLNFLHKKHLFQKELILVFTSHWGVLLVCQVLESVGSSFREIGVRGQAQFNRGHWSQPDHCFVRARWQPQVRMEALCAAI